MARKFADLLFNYWYIVLALVSVAMWLADIQGQTIRNRDDIAEIKQVIRVDLRQSIEDLQRLNIDMTKTVYTLEGCINGKKK